MTLCIRDFLCVKSDDKIMFTRIVKSCTCSAALDTVGLRDLIVNQASIPASRIHTYTVEPR